MQLDRRILVVLVALLLTVPAATVVAQGPDRGEDARGEQGDDRGGDDDDREGDEERRKVEVSRSDQGVVFELEKETDADEEKVKIAFSSDESELKLEFERKNETETANGSVETEDTFEYKVDLMRLVEYDDADGDDVLTDADDVASEVDLDGVAWTIGDVEDVTLDGQSAKKVTATADLGGNGTFKLVFYAVGDFAQVNATSLRPTDVKIDFVIDRYPWQGNDTRLALDLKTEVKSESEVETEGNATAMNATAGDISGYFTWAPTATVDGAETNVTSRIYEDTTKTETETETDDGESESESEVEREQKLTLNYAHGDRIVHDPVIGIQYGTASVQQSTLPSLGALGAIAAVGAALWVLRRRG